MSTLVAIQYDDPYKAQEVRLALVKLQREYLIDMEDAVVAAKDKNGKIKLHQAMNLTAAGALSGGLLGDADRDAVPESAARGGCRRFGRSGFGGAQRPGDQR